MQSLQNIILQVINKNQLKTYDNKYKIKSSFLRADNDFPNERFYQGQVKLFSKLS